MKLFGLKKDHVDLIKKVFEDVFGSESDVKVYLFGSRATGTQKKNSDIDLAFKSKAKDLDQKISVVKEKLEESNLPYIVDLLNWDKILKEYFPSVNKNKVPFWTPRDIERFSPWRICPLGQHWVVRHDRNLKTGTLVDRDGHCRKNPSGKDILKGDEIDLIPHLKIFQNPNEVVTVDNFGYGKLGNQYDHLINGWTSYWNDVFKVNPPLHPNYVKVLIATESSFRNKAVNKTNKIVNGDAQGLVQIMQITQKYLRGYRKELKNHLVDLKPEEFWEPNKNICAAVRWLFRKRELITKPGKTTNWVDVLYAYKGASKSKDSPEKRALEKHLKMIHE